MTRLYLDTEYNGFAGPLISIALYWPGGEEDFYEVVEVPADPIPFVAQHVIPILRKEPVGYDLVKAGLRSYLMGIEEPHFIADFPEDIMHLCAMLCGPNGEQFNIPRYTMEMVVTPDLSPHWPDRHNALADAHGLGKWHMKAYPYDARL
jgi:hypothetical protein